MRNVNTRTIGLLGLGVMGYAIGKRLVGLGWEVWGHDINSDAASRAAAIGVVITTATEFRSVDVLVSCLPDDGAVNAALAGSEGLVNHLRPEATLIETSTILPDTVRSIAEACRERHIHIIDCGISGGPEEAEAGTLILLVGASTDDLSEAMPLLSGLGTVSYAGDVGDGKIVKLVNNVMTMGNILIAAEAFALGTRAGIPGDRLFNILSTSGGRSHQFLKRFPRLLERDFTGRFTLRLGAKDLKLALDLATRVGTTMAATALAREAFGVAARTYSPDEDIVAVAKLYESATTTTTQ
jgi:3-hydroxyisobutyrate dehydrogenase-like beta-hydroxyacid dehydrogenase